MINFIKEKFLVLVSAAVLVAPIARGNIYVTDLRLNGVESLSIGVGTDVNITYVLNEPATLGVTINIVSGTNLVRTISAAPGAQGALLGRNLLVWNGDNSSGFPALSGQYTVSVTAAANGFTNWTQISQDTNAGNYVFDPRGLAVNNNTNSPYYGRVFVGNAGTGPNYATIPGDQDTILKLNADGSFADEGPDGNGGYNIFDDGNNDVPQKMRVAEDDRLYMVDLTGYAAVAAFDMLLSTNEVVFDSDNYMGNPFWPNSISQGVGWFSMDVTSANTTNGLIWLGQWDAGGAGNLELAFDQRRGRSQRRHRQLGRRSRRQPGRGGFGRFDGGHKLRYFCGPILDGLGRHQRGLHGLHQLEPRPLLRRPGDQQRRGLERRRQ